MAKYLLGMVAGMSIVPFVYLSQIEVGVTPKFYVFTLGTPIALIAVTAYLAFKTKVGKM